MTGLGALRRDVVILACAISAGIHAALAPVHFAEGSAPGTAFAAAAVVLAVLAVALTRHPGSAVPPTLAAVAFACLIAGYGLAATTGLPLVQPHPEPVDGLALATKAVEAGGLLLAGSLVRDRLPNAPIHRHAKGTPT